MKIRTKAFTLVELIISIVIVALLTWVIFQTYRTILDITVRVENEKIVANEMLFAHQVIQSLVDNYEIDYVRYMSQGNNIATNNGVTQVLYLTGRGGDSSYAWSYEITQVGNAIMLRRWVGTQIPLTDDWAVTISGLQFQLIPFNTTWANVSWAIPIGNLYFMTSNDIQHPAFWMRGMMYIERYRPNSYIWSVKQPIQSFFNIRSY